MVVKYVEKRTSINLEGVSLLPFQRLTDFYGLNPGDELVVKQKWKKLGISIEETNEEVDREIASLARESEVAPDLAGPLSYRLRCDGSSGQS